MPDVDMSSVLCSPLIANESFTVVRRQETVGANGRTTLKTSTFRNLWGSVQPTGDNSLVREAAFSAQQKSLRVVTEFRLRGQAKDGLGRGYQPDIVQWGGNSYLVHTVEDFTSYGSGLVQADCIEYDYEVAPPAEFAPPYVGRLDFTQTGQSQLLGIW